jgi:CBS domain-containing protein
MKEQRVGDLIKEVEEPKWILSGSLVIEALGRMCRQMDKGEAPLLLVVRQKNFHREAMGAITLDGLLSKLEPPAYSKELELPIFWQGQLSEEARALFSKEVDSVMEELKHALNQNSTLMEALHLMNSRGTSILVVVDEDQMVGLLTRQHLTRQILNLAGC